MTMPADGIAGRGLALGAWGAAQATAAGLSIAIGGALRDTVNGYALSGALGEALATPATGYSFVYHLEIGLLFITLVALGPLVRVTGPTLSPHDGGSARIGLADLPT
jgi:PUCC protein.